MIFAYLRKRQGLTVARQPASPWQTRLAFAVLLLVIGAALSASLVFTEDPMDMVGDPLLWPGDQAAYPLGTDQLGRDVAVGLAYGARVSLMVGAIAAGLTFAIALVVGMLGGYFGGTVDKLTSWLTETFQSIPSFLLVIVIVTISGPSALVIATAVGLVAWPGLARVVRAEFRSLKHHEFVLASRAIGASHFHVITREILPNALPPLLAMAAVEVSVAILAEAGLAFIGLGDPNTMSWGAMIGNGRNFLRSAWYLCAVPGLAIAVTVWSVSVLSESLGRQLHR